MQGTKVLILFGLVNSSLVASFSDHLRAVISKLSFFPEIECPDEFQWVSHLCLDMSSNEGGAKSFEEAEQYCQDQNARLYEPRDLEAYFQVQHSNSVNLTSLYYLDSFAKVRLIRKL